ncbi:MAG: hypothetical protein ACHQNV_10450, partial [Vicinamibacteria bacterium]
MNLEVFFFALAIVAARPLGAADAGPLPVSDAVMHRTWTGRWIACPDAPERDPGVFRFRKVLEMAAVPGRFVVHVSGDQRFILFVNGRRVGVGPSRGDLYHWRFETFDLAPRLNPARNLLVATVWNFWTQAPAAKVTERSGFVVEGDGDGEKAANTDGSWQCAPEPGHQPWPEGAAALKRATYAVVGPGERLEAARYDWDWERLPLSGDPGRWRAAVESGPANPRTISEGPGYGLSPEGRWLVPDKLPPMESRPVSAGTVAKAS